MTGGPHPGRSALAWLLLGPLACVPCARAAVAPAHALHAAATAERAWRPSAREQAFADTLERRTFEWFRDKTDPKTGLTPDRAPAPSFVSVAAVGFALSAWPIGAERGYVPRAEAAERALVTLNTLWWARQDTARAGAAGYRGFFYHFLEPRTGARFKDVELSTQDTALLMAGVLFCESYFDRADPREAQVRALAESLYERVDWRWAQNRPPQLTLGWEPESGFLPYDWGGYNEAAMLHILALGSPTHGVGPNAWRAFTRGYEWGSFHGVEHLCFPPLFGHQYSHCWLDFRGIRDSVMAAHHSDYFENSRLATLSQQRYAIDDTLGWRDYGERGWGISACDGPLDSTFLVNGVPREFHTYAGRGVSIQFVNDDGTLSPAAVAGSLPFLPQQVLPTLVAMREHYGDAVFNGYGFVDAFNPTLVDPRLPVRMGHVVPGLGWFDDDQLGIDQGPILIMLENWRSGLVWRCMRRNPHVVRGLRAAGFRGGWLAAGAAR